MAKSILPTLKARGYKINAHVLFAPAESRKQALLHRINVQDFYQVTEADAKGKVAPVFDRLKDAVLKYADTATMYLNSGKYWKNTTEAQNAASWRKFATFDRDGATGEVKVVGVLEDSATVLDELTTEVRQEVKDLEQQQELIAMFNSWLVEPQAGNYFLPGFNRDTAIAAAVGLGIFGLAVAIGQNESLRNTIIERFRPST